MNFVTDGEPIKDPVRESFEPSSPAEIRRGSALLALACALLLTLCRFVFWRGKDTSELTAFGLFFLLLYAIFGFVQMLFGVSISETYSHFKQTNGKQKLLYFAMLAVTLGLLFPLCGYLFPGIDAKIHR